MCRDNLLICGINHGLHGVGPADALSVAAVSGGRCPRSAAAMQPGAAGAPIPIGLLGGCDHGLHPDTSGQSTPDVQITRAVLSQAHSIYERGLYAFGGGETSKYWQSIPSWEDVKGYAQERTSAALPEPTAWEQAKAFVLRKPVRQVQVRPASIFNNENRIWLPPPSWLRTCVHRMSNLRIANRALISNSSSHCALRPLCATFATRA